MSCCSRLLTIGEHAADRTSAVENASGDSSNTITVAPHEFCDHSASSEMLACSVGDSPTGEKVRDPVAWVAFVEETKRMKPTDKAILGMVSESPGRNVSEPRSGLDKKYNPKAEPSMVGRRQHDMAQTDRSGMSIRRGGRDSTVTRTCRATGETVLVPSRNRWSKVGRITGKTGKAIEGETVAAGPVVAEKRGNARGAKGPCCTCSLYQEGRQG
jgi:hypothetical protein